MRCGLKRSSDRVITYSFADDFIGTLAGRLVKSFLKAGSDLSRLAVVFGGRRPALFLARELAERIGRSFYPPRFFSMDEFIHYLIAQREPCRRMPDMDASYLIYQLARSHAPGMLRGRETFAQFLPWAREAAAFIDQLDLEDIEAASLRDIQLSAAIGYEVPESVNTLLRHIIVLREEYHRAMGAQRAYSRGLMYLRAARAVPEIQCAEFEKILFCNFFYLHTTEAAVIRELYERERALLFFQKGAGAWPVFDRLSELFSCPIEPRARRGPSCRVSLHAGFDTHSQVGLVRDILEKIKNLDQTVVVLPSPHSIVPLLSEISSCAGEFNVSMGYPLKRSALYNLLERIVRAQASRKGGAYYARDYLGVLTHPLLKNMRIALEPAVTRVLVHKVEEVLSGVVQTPLGGSLFVTLEEVSGLDELYRRTAATLAQMDIQLDAGELPGVLQALHEIAFHTWEHIDSFGGFSRVLERFLDILLQKSCVSVYFLNLKVAEKILALGDELRNAAFSGEHFEQDELFTIFLHRLESEMVSFSGSPLKGLQILGLLETRSLNFENVIIMDVNESALPSLRVCEPLIPRQVMVGLGLNRMEQEEEIQRYQFTRLISHAKHVHLVYDDRPDKERSRFIEEIVWEKQKERASLDALPVRRARFRADIAPVVRAAGKKPAVRELLRNFTYSSSSVDAYVECPLSFYYRYMLGLSAREDLLEEPEGADVGTFIHRLLHDAFREFIGEKPRIDRGFMDRFFKEMDRQFEAAFSRRMKSDAFMLQGVMRTRLEQFLEREAEREVRELVSLEDDVGGVVMLAGHPRIFRCRVDRIDRMEDGSILIIDYKTGATDRQPRGRAVLEMSEFSRESVKRAVRSFQLPLYCYFVGKRYGGVAVRAAAYNLRTLELNEFPGRRECERGEELMEKCLSALGFIIGEILNPDVPFRADEENERRCARCPFFYLCR